MTLVAPVRDIISTSTAVVEEIVCAIVFTFFLGKLYFYHKDGTTIQFLSIMQGNRVKKY
jgi:hypothetical protein